MAPGRFSPRAKTTMVLCCILLLVASVLLYTGYTSQTAQQEHYVQLHLRKVADRMAGQMNGDGLLSLKPGDEGTPRYLAFAHALYEGRSNDSYIVTAYLLRVDNGTIRYVVHDAYLTRGPDPYVARIGDLVTEDRAVILNASAGGAVYSPALYTSKWGSYLSGYAPVKDSDGTVVGVLGVDETADTVFQYETYRFLNLVEVS
jgi:hypothetical protein